MRDDHLDGAAVIDTARLVLAEATRRAAIAARRRAGNGDLVDVDRVAVDALRHSLDAAPFGMCVTACEGEKDEAPMLMAAERLGRGAVVASLVADPVDGTRACAHGRDEAVCAVALAEHGSILDLGRCSYVEKLVAPADVPLPPVDSSRPPHAVLDELLTARPGLRVGLLRRPRHEAVARHVESRGGAVRWIEDADVARTINVLHSGATRGWCDVLYGITGTSEALLSAAFARCIGGTVLARPAPRDPAEARSLRAHGLTPTRTCGTRSLVGGRWVVAAAAGVTACPSPLGAARSEPRPFVRAAWDEPPVGMRRGVTTAAAAG